MKSAIRALAITHEEVSRSLKGRPPNSPQAILVRISLHEIEQAIQVLTKYDEEQQAAQAENPAEENAFEEALQDIKAGIIQESEMAQAIRGCQESLGSGSAALPSVRDNDGERQLPPSTGQE